MMAETATVILDLLILLWLVGTWFYEGHHRRCTVITRCPKCGNVDSVHCASADNATSTIQIFCGEMPVLGTSDPLVHTTTKLVCKFTVTLKDGTVLNGTITYLACLIRFIHPGLWRVDKAPAIGDFDNGWKIALTLDPEDVTWDGIGERIAQACNGTGTITDQSGKELATLSLVSPAVGSYRAHIGEFIVKPCVEDGVVQWTVNP
jgi:hypothetical protein